MAQPPWFRQVFDQHYAEIVRHVQWLLQDRSEAEDIVQEAFLRLYLSSTGPPVRPRNWLLRVATRLAYNHLRGRQRRRQREETYAGDAAQGPGGTGAMDPGDAAVTGWAVRQVLDRLEPRDRMLLLLHAVGYRYREMAEVLDVEPSSVGTLLARARRRFAVIWAEWNPATHQREGERTR